MDSDLWNQKYQESEINTRRQNERLRVEIENLEKTSKNDVECEKVEDLKGISDEEESESEIDDDFINVPPCMLGRPLKDFDCENDNVSEKQKYKINYQWNQNKHCFEC